MAKWITKNGGLCPRWPVGSFMECLHGISSCLPKKLRRSSEAWPPEQAPARQEGWSSQAVAYVALGWMQHSQLDNFDTTWDRSETAEATVCDKWCLGRRLRAEHGRVMGWFWARRSIGGSRLWVSYYALLPGWLPRLGTSHGHCCGRIISENQRQGEGKKWTKLLR